MLLSLPAWAQDAAPAAAEKSLLAEISTPVLVAASIAGLLFAGIFFFAVTLFIQSLPFLRNFYAHPAREHSLMAKLVNLSGGNTTLLTGKAKDVLMEDHDYDGIHEFDNDLPPWWKALFYVTAVFAVVYLVNFHVLGGKLQTAEYEAEMQQAALLKPATGAGNPNEKTDYKPLTDKAQLEAGHAAYTANCAACHGQNGEGMVGPNLTDEYWLHGGDVNALFKTIKYGVTSKGMVAWQGKLSDDQIVEVASYILTLQGTNPANAKAPQGEKAK